MSNKEQSIIKIILDDEEHEFSMGYNGETILEVAQNEGIDVPFSCQGGVCRTCMALVKEGEVEMDENYVLEDDEVESGFVLTCQSHPRSPRVVMDFDDL
jgi:ring-1,2-phenylacetyl-CoA epoxidase subunit PaaE